MGVYTGPLLIDTDTKRLLELTATADRAQDAVEEIVSIVQRKAANLLDGLTDSNKAQIACHCQTKLYANDEVVFHQGDEPDAYYTVIRGAVSIYALNSSSKDGNSSDHHKGRSKYGVFITQLPPGESFGELSFNGDGNHSRRNAGVVSDGCHGESRIIAKQHGSSSSTSSSSTPEEVSDGCVLLLIPDKCYMREMYARHAAKHQTKDKINLLKSSSLFQHWTMDQLVKIAYVMKKRCFDKGSVIIQQGERMEHLWIIKSGTVRIIQKGIRNDVNARNGRRNSKEPVSVDIADLGAKDMIGLIECIDESAKKSQREAIVLTASELFFVPLSFFRPLLVQDACTFSLAEQVVERRRKWAEIRKEYAAKFPKMSMKLPKDAASMSNYAMDGCAISPKARTKRTSSKKELSSSIGSPSGLRRRPTDSLMRQQRRTTLDKLADEAGLS
eukprot:CAMPEP_0196134162 /NCGR_PEP_ID=MMETSP0910-20130528/3125_1 /TAXON_ID=49265 /ORGANISM="Thalassiosira rotula, Strain GSO102" /LENGTH=442 /DNA_ID=CAMNT_0041393993 /DNA_START=36 /DNA_END=1364 /DNA_ORIENTATION=-